MAITQAEVERIARLARLNFTEQEKQKMISELGLILDYVDQLKEVHDQVATKPFDDPDGVNLMRDDFAEKLTEPQELLKQAPDREGDFVKVKSVLE